MSVFKDAKLTLITDDGTELNVDVTRRSLRQSFVPVASVQKMPVRKT